RSRVSASPRRSPRARVRKSRTTPTPSAGAGESAAGGPCLGRARGSANGPRIGDTRRVRISIAADELTGIAPLLASELERRGHDTLAHRALHDAQRGQWAGGGG